ncbi:MAG TPA: YifB family Mg chelatase-like AAA ATPase [Myxococcales bacterium]|nr:YifB family Mg chelatase-like AAA ATPase [Myxococcales bacterium]
MGIDAVMVDVEVDMTIGLPFLNVVGLADGAAKESKVRVISALKNSGFELPHKRITVNLAPADLKKEGAGFELPFALGVLGAAKQLEEAALRPYVFAGELSLDGVIKPIRGVLSLAIAARDHGFKGVMVPAANAPEAALVDRIQVIPVGSLKQAVDHLNGTAELKPFARERMASRRSGALPDMADVRGQPEVKDALELAAAGGHNVLMCGPPGSGKTMLARRLPGILPRMTFQEALEVTKIYSVLGMTAEGQALLADRPFRSPHHTISDAGLVGGGPLMRPGELSMAHHGVLFLDELAEFRKNVLEVLRQPLEEGQIHLARANHHIVYPCRVMLVAAMNPCPCGYFNVAGRPCTCSPQRVADYHARVSGPLIDRIDITLQTRAVGVHGMAPDARERPSAEYRVRVERAREIQQRRFASEPGVHCNAQMTPELLHKHCALRPAGRALLARAIQEHGLSARAHDRILKLARTRADLEGRGSIEESDLCLAIDCRLMDRKSWAWSMGTAGYNQKDDYMNRAMREVRQALEEREQQRAQAEEAEETEKADEPF